MNYEKLWNGHKRDTSRNLIKKTAPAPEFKVGDRVWLNWKDIGMTRPSQKLDYRWLGPFEIINVVGESKAAFELGLPPHWRIHPVFHGLLLDPYRVNKIEEREQPTPLPPEIVNGELKYEMEVVLDSRVQRNKLQYFARWKGYGPEERTWEPVENLENAKEAVAAFHLRHPKRPSRTDLTNPKPCRSSACRRGGTVMNESSGSPERADLPEAMWTQREARPMSRADACWSLLL